MPRVVERIVGRGRSLLFASSVDSLAWSELPRCWPFVILVDQWLQGLARQATTPLTFIAGDRVSLPLPTETAGGAALLRAPDLTQRRVELVTNARELTVANTSVLGITRFSVPGKTPPEIVAAFSLQAVPEESESAATAPRRVRRTPGRKTLWTGPRSRATRTLSQYRTSRAGSLRPVNGAADLRLRDRADHGDWSLSNGRSMSGQHLVRHHRVSRHAHRHARPVRKTGDCDDPHVGTGLGWWWIVFAAVGLFGFVYLLDRAQLRRLSPARRWPIRSLKIAAVLVILLALLRPALQSSEIDKTPVQALIVRCQPQHEYGRRSRWSDTLAIIERRSHPFLHSVGSPQGKSRDSTIRVRQNRPVTRSRTDRRHGRDDRARE